MIDVSEYYRTVLKNTDVRNIIYKVSIRDNCGNTEVDISDRVKEIEITRELESSNASCKLVIDNSDGLLSINNKNSYLNYNRGEFKPLLDFGKVVRIYAGLKEVEFEDVPEVILTKQSIIKNFSSAEFYNTEPTSEGVKLAYTLGNEYVISSQEQYDNFYSVGRQEDRNFSYKQIYGQIIKLNTTVRKKLSKFSVYMRQADSNLYWGQSLSCCNLYKWYWNSSNSYWDNVNYPPPAPFSLRNSMGYAEVYKIKTGWVDFVFKDIFLEPNIEYMFLVESLTSVYSPKDGFKNNDSVALKNNITNYNIFVYNENSYATWMRINNNQSMAFKLYVRDILYKNNGYVIVTFDCGSNVSKYVSVTVDCTDTVSYQFASSYDGNTWSEWFNNLSQVPVARFLKVKVILSTNNQLYSPILKSVTLNYEVVISQPPDGMVQIFTGIIGDEIEEDVNNGVIYLGCRDFSKCLQDIFISLSKSYNYVLLEDVILDLLKTYIPQSVIYFSWGIIDFYYEPTYYVIKNYQIRNMSLWEAIQQLVNSIGWYLMFDEFGVLRLFKRKRDGVAVEIFNEDLIVTESLSLSDTDIRNEILVKAETTNGIIQITVKDEESIKKYGRRFMEVDRSLSSFIYDQNAAKELATAILEDLHLPKGMTNIVLPFYPLLQLGDIIGIDSPSSGLSSQEQLYKITGITHTLSETNKQTVLKTKLFKDLWTTVSFTPSAPEQIFIELVDRTISYYPGCGWSTNEKARKFYYPKLSWSHPTTNTDGTPIEGLVGFNIYRSFNNNNYDFVSFVPASFTSVDMPINWFIDYSCGPGTVYYKVQCVNKWNKKSPFSSVVSITVPNYEVIT